MQNLSTKSLKPLKVGGVLWRYMLCRLLSSTDITRMAATLENGSEDASAAAYMALVKLGPKNIEKLGELAATGISVEGIVQVLGDIGHPSAIAILEPYLSSPNEKIAETTRESIALLQSASP